MDEIRNEVPVVRRRGFTPKTGVGLGGRRKKLVEARKLAYLSPKIPFVVISKAP